MVAVVSKQLKSYLLAKDLISSRQYGFRPGNSTVDLLTVLTQKWNTCLNKGEEVCVVAYAPIRSAEESDSVAASINGELKTMGSRAD